MFSRGSVSALAVARKPTEILLADFYVDRKAAIPAFGERKPVETAVRNSRWLTFSHVSPLALSLIEINLPLKVETSIEGSGFSRKCGKACLENGSS